MSCVKTKQPRKHCVEVMWLNVDYDSNLSLTAYYFINTFMVSVMWLNVDYDSDLSLTADYFINTFMV